MNSIQIGPLRYEIVEVPDLRGKHDQGLFGAVDYHPCRIQLEANMEAQRRPMTLLHEVLHALLDQMPSTKDEEQWVKGVAYGVSQVLKDNPEFARMFIEAGDASA